MDFATAMHGHGANAQARQDVMRAMLRLVQALTVLDTSVKFSPAQRPWLRIEFEAGLAAAAREAGGEASLEDILSARMGARSLPRGHVPLTDLDARAQQWRHIAQRKGPAHLRGLVARLVPSRGTRDFLGLASNVTAALADCAAPSWHWDGQATVTIEGALPDMPDAGDLVMATPFALRRAGVVRQLLPSITGRPRLIARAADPLELLALWLAGMEKQVEESAFRLRLLERHMAVADTKLADVRRPTALKRLVAVSLQSWGVWAAQLARLTGVEVSSAWRTLEQAAEMGLVASVPISRRSRGDAQLYAAPPWLRIAGLISGARGRPGSIPPMMSVPGGRLADAIAQVDDVLASIDTLLLNNPFPK